MKAEKQVYLYSILAIIGASLAYYFIVQKKDKSSAPQESNDKGTVDASTTVKSSTGEDLTIEQVEIPKELADILSKTALQATALLKNKSVYTKLNNVNVRDENYVNNGFLDNVLSIISDKATFIGNVISIMDDKVGLKDKDGRVYKWFKIKPSQDAIDNMNKNKSTFMHKISLTTNPSIYVREDAISLNKN